MDRVTMKGGSPTLLTIKPLNSPHMAPAARAARQATPDVDPHQSHLAGNDARHGGHAAHAQFNASQNQSQGQSDGEQAVGGHTQGDALHVGGLDELWIDDGHDGHHKQNNEKYAHLALSEQPLQKLRSRPLYLALLFHCRNSFSASCSPEASFMIFSSVTSSPSRKPAKHPSCMTATRSDTPMTSGSSLDTTITPTPLSAS